MVVEGGRGVAPTCTSLGLGGWVGGKRKVCCVIPLMWGRGRVVRFSLVIFQLGGWGEFFEICLPHMGVEGGT